MYVYIILFPVSFYLGIIEKRKEIPKQIEESL